MGAAVVTPLVVAAVALGRSPALRAGLGAIPLESLIAVHVIRLLGLFFVLLHAGGRLSAPFGPAAEWGDLAAAAVAPVVAWAARRRVVRWRTMVFAWNAFGLVDLLVAVGLGITSAPGAPFRLFLEEPGTALMGTLPWVLIPTFLVPLLVLAHVAVFQRLRGAASLTSASA